MRVFRGCGAPLGYPQKAYFTALRRQYILRATAYFMLYSFLVYTLALKSLMNIEN